MSTRELLFLDRRTGDLQYGISCASCQLAVEKLTVPNESGRWLYRARDQVFSKTEFLLQFRWCQQAQLLWLSSADGLLEPDELPYGVKRCGYFDDRN